MSYEICMIFTQSSTSTTHDEYYCRFVRGVCADKLIHNRFVLFLFDWIECIRMFGIFLEIIQTPSKMSNRNKEDNFPTSNQRVIGWFFHFANPFHAAIVYAVWIIIYRWIKKTLSYTWHWKGFCELMLACAHVKHVFFSCARL